MIGTLIFTLLGVGFLTVAYKRVLTGWYIGPVEGWRQPREAQPIRFWLSVVQAAAGGLFMLTIAVGLALNALGLISLK